MTTGETSWRRERPEGEAVPEAIPAATTVLVRDGADGVEVLMARRNSRLSFAGGAWVFPGGRVDPDDWEGEPVDDLRDPRMLDAARRAAVREAAEETGAVVEPATLVLISHWTPPIQAPKRFATYFFLGPAPVEITDLQADGGEIHELGWLRPGAAIEARNAREIELVPPTYITLEHLLPFATRRRRPGPLLRPAARALRHVVHRGRRRDGGPVRGRCRLRHRRRRPRRDPATGCGCSRTVGATSEPPAAAEPAGRPPGWHAPGVSDTADAPRPVGRPRDPHVDRAVIDATAAMLTEVGYGGITIEAVAQVAGVSKNAIYRRWPDKVSMVLDTLENVAPTKEQTVDTGDIRADMATMLHAIADALRSVDGRLAMALASDITRHPELAEAFRSRLVEPRREELEHRVRQAVDAGQLPADSDVELLTEIGPALLYHRMLFDGVPPDHDYVQRIVDQFWS